MDELLKNHILAVTRALNDVEVRGKDNITKLLASIQHLESIANGELGNFVRKDDTESEN